MSDNENNKNLDSVEKSENIDEPKEDSQKKEKFTCVRSFNSCEKRGPIPIVFSDLEFWANEGVLDNFMGHLRINKNSKGLFEMVMSPIKFEPDLFGIPKNDRAEEQENDNPEDGEEKDEIDATNEKSNEEEEEQDIDKIRCPMFNLQNRECLVYKYRPIACRAYPLEYDGNSYLTVDSESPREGNGDCVKDERLEMKNNAEKMFHEYNTMRISIPVLFSVVQREIMPIAEQQALFKIYMENQKAMQDMDPEDLKKLQELMSKTNKEENPNEDLDENSEIEEEK